VLPILEDYLERLQALHESIESAIEGLPQAALDWVPGPDMNSFAVLVTHVAGAERYWIGDVAGRDPSGCGPLLAVLRCLPGAYLPGNSPGQGAKNWIQGVSI